MFFTSKDRGQIAEAILKAKEEMRRDIEERMELVTLQSQLHQLFHCKACDKIAHLDPEYFEEIKDKNDKNKCRTPGCNRIMTCVWDHCSPCLFEYWHYLDLKEKYEKLKKAKKDN